jgi:hypothetical protein
LIDVKAKQGREALSNEERSLRKAAEWEVLTIAVTFLFKEEEVIRTYGNLGSM